MEKIKYNIIYKTEGGKFQHFNEIEATPTEEGYKTSNGRLLALATALYSRFAEWKPASEAPLESGKYWVRFDKEEPFIAYYSARVNKWRYAGQEIKPTHYTPILKPQI